MRKLIISTLAMASVLATAAVAHAQYIPGPFCRWVFNGFGWVWYCGF
jgi:hypothetical protein